MFMDKTVLTSDSPKQRVAKCLKCCVYIGLHCSKSSFTNEKRELPFWPQNLAYWRVKQHRKFVFWQTATTNRKIYFLTTDPRVVMAICRGTRNLFVFLPQFMAICCRYATKYSFQMLTLVTLDTWNVTALMPWCNLSLLWRMGKGNLE